jgi:hypothetical protein
LGPWKTCISLHTHSSFPLTSFLLNSLQRDVCCDSGRGGGNRGDRGRGRGLCRVTVTIPVKLGRSLQVVHLAPCCLPPSPRTVQDTSTQVSRVLISPFPLRAPVRPPLPLSICSLLASLHAPCSSKSADHRSTLRLAGRHSPPLRRPRSPRRYVRLPIVFGPCAEPRSPAVAVSPPFRATRLLAHWLRFVVSDPYRVLYLPWFAPRLVFLHLFLCVVFRSLAPCPECPFIR